MSAEENKRLVRQFYQEVINDKNPAAIDNYVSANIMEHEDLTPFPKNREGVRQFFAAVLAGFPDMQVTVDDVIAEGDKVVARTTLTGTHQGEFLGLPATGKSVKFGQIDIVRVEGGQAVEHWGVADNLSLLQQLGAVPEPSRATA